MYAINTSETKIMKDLVKELSDLNSYIRKGIRPFGHDYINGNYFYAFNPSEKPDKEQYQRSIQLVGTICDVLDENCINISSRGYSYIKDAICIITDRRSLDVCFLKEVYPYIAEKYTKKNIDKVEHGIRNAIEAGFRRAKTDYPERKCIMNSFESKPSNKTFLLCAVQEVSDRLLKEFLA